MAYPIKFGLLLTLKGEIPEVPKGLVTEYGLPLNKGNIYIAKTSPPSVHEAYLDQFQKDFTTFLSMTCEEMVDFGSLVLTFICKIDEDDGCDFWELLGITVNDMVIEVTINRRARSRSCIHCPGMRWNCSSSPGANRTHSRRKLEPNSGKFLPGNAMEVLQHSKRISVAEVKQKAGQFLV
ncbi:hypothetical protein BC332_08638 [Capsicum chinense]|nr:hypothetical protein BC332_08638 [Capsicum chinense]